MVGRAIVWAVPENDTTPTRNFAGSSLRNTVAACSAASSLVGCTSVAFIEPDTSITSMTVACSLGTRVTACGRAIPSSSAASASR